MALPRNRGPGQSKCWHSNQAHFAAPRASEGRLYLILRGGRPVPPPPNPPGPVFQLAV